MREEVLRDFLDGKINGATLSRDLVGTVEGSGKVFHYRIEDLDEDYEIRSEHIVRLCDAVLVGDLTAKDLETIGFCLAASDSFHWDTDIDDGEIVAEIIFDWSDAEINYPLTQENVVKFLEWLLTGDNPFAETDVSK